MAPKEPVYGGQYDEKMQQEDLSLPQVDGSEVVNRNPPLLSLFDQKYLRQPMTKLQWLALILYTPFGVVLAFLRVFATVIVCLFATFSERFLPWKLSDRTLFRIICIIAGVYVRKINGKLPTEKEMAHSFIVSNHTMTGDPGVLYFLYHKNAKVVHKSNVGSFDIITRHKIKVGGDKNQVKQQILDSIEKDPTPVVIYPEGATTNGNVGLLRFSAFIFSLDRPIFPVGVRYYPAFPFIPFHSLKPYYTFHMFLVAFQPFVAVETAVLSKQIRNENETPEQFAERVQKQIGGAIGLIPTTYSANDKSSLRNSAAKKTN